MNKFTKAILPAFVTLVYCGNSSAALVTQTFTGQFDFVDGPFTSSEASLSSLSLSASVSGSVAYDDALVAEIGETFLGPVDALSLNFGALSFNEMDDLDYGPGPFGSINPFPDADFMDGTLTGIGFFTDYVDAMDEVVWELDMSGNVFEFFDFASGDVVASGTLDFAPTVVPVPAAVWLFGSGLIGLVGVARRNTRS